VSDLNPLSVFRILVFPVSFSLAVGLLVVLDSTLAPYHPLWQSALDYEIARNFLWTITTFSTLVLIAIAANYRDCLFNHRYQIAAIIMIVAPAIGGINLIRLDPPDLAMVLVTLFWLASVIVEDRPVLVPRVLIVLMLCLMWLTIGALMTKGPSVFLSLPSVISKLMVIFLLANLIATRHDHEVALKALVVVAAISACIAILILALYLLTGYALTFDDRKDEHFKCYGWICMFRATGLTPTPQMLGHLLVMGIALGLFMPLRTWMRLLLVAVMIAGAVLTLSVGVVLAVSVVLVLFPIYRWPSRYAHILTTYATTIWLTHVTGLWAWVYQFANKFLLADLGVNIRVWTYRGGADLIEKNPGFGIGALRHIPGSMHFSTPHNTYMQVALEMGLPAWLLFTTLLVYLFLSCWRIAARAKDPVTRRWMSGMLLGFSGMLVHFISEPMFPNNLPWTFMGLITAGIIVYGRTRTDPQWAAISRARPRVQRLARTMRNAGHQ